MLSDTEVAVRSTPPRRRTVISRTAAGPIFPNEESSPSTVPESGRESARRAGVTATKPDWGSPPTGYATAPPHNTRPVPIRRHESSPPAATAVASATWPTPTGFLPALGAITGHITPASRRARPRDRACMKIFGSQRRHVRRERRAPGPSKERTKLRQAGRKDYRYPSSSPGQHS